MTRDPAATTRLLAAAHRQDGLFTRAQAYAAGLSRHALAWQSGRGGRWRQVLPGVYAAFTGDLSDDQRLRAALLYAGPGAVLYGPTVCRLVGLPAPADGAVHVLLTRAPRRNSAGFVVLHRTRNPPRPARLGRWPICPLPRAVVEVARRQAALDPVRDLLCGAVQRKLARAGQLAQEAARPGLARPAPLRRALVEAAGGSHSVAEARLLALVRRAALPEPELNKPVRLPGGRTAVPDLRWGRVIVEVDSREWHLTASAWRETMARHAMLTAAGYLVLHFSPADVEHRAAWVLGRIREALAAAA